MHKIGVWNYYESLNKQNYLLLNKNAGIGDDLLSPFNALYLEGKQQGIDFMTLDMIEEFDKMSGFIFFDFPKMGNKYVKKAFDQNIPKYLVIFESEIIRPDNWDLENHKYFEKIFTWNDNFIDNKKYFKLNFSQDVCTKINKDLQNKNTLCTLISGNKKVSHDLELYSKRLNIILWFEKNQPCDFKFYGMGWDKYTHSNKYLKYALNKIKIPKLIRPKFNCYGGTVASKKDVLEQYKFAICYENAKNISGYITEKIFDCFFAGCVPIYLGANNITEHIPKDCFIDKREFSDNESLYKFISTMPDEEYLNYLNNIENFLNSDKMYQFSNTFFSTQIIANIQKEK